MRSWQEPSGAAEAADRAGVQRVVGKNPADAARGQGSARFHHQGSARERGGQMDGSQTQLRCVLGAELHQRAREQGARIKRSWQPDLGPWQREWSGEDRVERDLQGPEGIVTADTAGRGTLRG